MGKGRYVATKAELAGRLGISGWTLNSYWERQGRPQDHAPGKARYDISQYRDWIGSFKTAHNFGNKKNPASNGNGEYPVNERERALIDKKKIEIESAQFKLDVERGEYWKRTEVNEAVSKYNALVRRELYKAFEYDLPPRIEGMSAMDIKKALRKRLDEILRGLPKTFLAKG